MSRRPTSASSCTAPAHASAPRSRGTSMADGTAISCQHVVEIVTDYLEGKLAPEDVATFEAHLAICDGCQWYLDQIRLTVATVGRIEDADVPPALRDTVLGAFRTRRA